VIIVAATSMAVKIIAVMRISKDTDSDVARNDVIAIARRRNVIIATCLALLFIST